MPESPQTIIAFWFEDIEPGQWWQPEAAFDDLLRARFGEIWQQACAGELQGWRADARGRLAEVIVLDQFSRNIWRGTPRAFAQDAQALVLAQEAVAAGALDALNEVERGFLLMPWMHSESRVIHVEAEELFKSFATQASYEFELKHKRIIDRFGRYPHRNAILGRASSAEEREFLTQPDSAF